MSELWLCPDRSSDGSPRCLIPAFTSAAPGGFAWAVLSYGVVSSCSLAESRIRRTSSVSCRQQRRRAGSGRAAAAKQRSQPTKLQTEKMQAACKMLGPGNGTDRSVLTAGPVRRPCVTTSLQPVDAASVAGTPSWTASPWLFVYKTFRVVLLRGG